MTIAELFSYMQLLLFALSSIAFFLTFIVDHPRRTEVLIASIAGIIISVYGFVL